MPAVEFTADELAFLREELRRQIAIGRKSDTAFDKKSRGRLLAELALSLTPDDKTRLSRSGLRELQTWTERAKDILSQSIIPNYVMRAHEESNVQEKERLSKYRAKAQKKLDTVLLPMLQRIEGAR